MARLCATSALSGDWVEAYNYARKSLAARDYTSLPLMQPPCWYETEALIHGGDIELAKEDIKRLGEYDHVGFS